jgi:predicted lipoprotein with Yx(FWY)xxD motif
MNAPRSKIAGIAAMLSIILLALAACAPVPTPTPVPPTATPTTVPTKPIALAVATNDKFGKIIADGNGRTLYIFAKDTKDTSTCYDDCAKRWPPFLTQGKTDAMDGIDAASIGSTKRKDDTRQVTYQGWPLYYWNADTKPGDTFGQGIGGVWWVLMPDGTAVTAAPNPSITINLGPGRDGDQSGTATLTAKGNQTDVALNLKPGAAGIEQPVHIHDGQCPVPGAVKYPLKNLVDGKSTTTVDVPLASLLTGGLVINAHLSVAEAGKYVACGAIPKGVVLKLGPGRDADQAGAAVLLAQDSQTEVDLFIKPLPGLEQPAHIHEGQCPAPGAVKYPLTNIVDGRSKTVVEVALADLLKGGYVINAHLSKDQVGKYIACGAIQ